MDADVWWGARTYRLMAKVAVSQVSGEPEAIRRLQRSSARYFQRPDREGSTGGFFSNGWATTLRGNAVLRWEFRPGSTLFLVWTQDRNHTASTGDLRLDRDQQALFGAPADHIFQLKVSYWMGS